MQQEDDYGKFIADKHFRQVEAGFDYVCENPRLFDYQKATVEWALRRGRALVAKDTGLGKTLDELEFGQAVANHTDAPFLLLAPLCVGHQIHREAAEFGYRTKVIRDMTDVSSGINICNYELLHKLNFSTFSGIGLDEGSIIKGIDGKIRKALTEEAQCIPYRLSATATPAPNDFMEIGTQAEFLGIMTQVEMLATFFIHDGADTAKWRLKGHGKQKFFEWLATWAVIMRDPADYGFTPKPTLPPLNIQQVTVETEVTDGLFATVAQSLSERLNARRDTIDERCRKAAEIAAQLEGPVLLWCGLNAEGDRLQQLIPGAVQVAGSDKDADKESRLTGFSEGEYSALVTKPKIAGFGMNWQHCNQVIFVGLSDSFEQYYQAVRRCWRHGQKRDVNVWIITADSEGAVVENIRRKQIQADTMMAEMAKIASKFFQGFERAGRELRAYQPTKTAPMPQFVRACA